MAEGVQAVDKVRYDAFRLYSMRFGFLTAIFPILTLLPDCLEKPSLWNHFLASRLIWTAILLVYPLALGRKVPRKWLPWILYLSATILMVAVVREQVLLGTRVPEILLTICLLFVLTPILGVPFSWKENAIGIFVLLVAQDVLLQSTPELAPYLLRIELVALFLVVTMGFILREFERLLETQYAYQCRIEDLARKDPLTGLFNRRFFMEFGERSLKQGARKKRPVTLVQLDLDHFKAINDRFGHPAGDAVICATARLMTHEVRETDLVARIGGEEFVLLFPETSLEAGSQVAERIRKGIEAMLIRVEGLPVPLRITASFGLALADCERDTLETLMGKADEALYRAKGSGRNRVEHHEALAAGDGSV